MENFLCNDAPTIYRNDDGTAWIQWNDPAEERGLYAMSGEILVQAVDAINRAAAKAQATS